MMLMSALMRNPVHTIRTRRVRRAVPITFYGDNDTVAFRRLHDACLICLKMPLVDAIRIISMMFHLPPDLSYATDIFMLRPLDVISAPADGVVCLLL